MNPHNPDFEFPIAASVRLRASMADYLQPQIDLIFRILHRRNMLPYTKPKLPLLCMGDKPAFTICTSSDWLHRFLLRHKGLRNWLRWHFL